MLKTNSIVQIELLTVSRFDRIWLRGEAFSASFEISVVGTEAGEDL